MNEKLKEVFADIRETHYEYNIRRRISKTALGSLTRNFTSDTNENLYKYLFWNIEVEDLLSLNCQKAYKEWFENILRGVARLIKRTSPESKKPNIYPGYKWGFAAKALNLYLRDIVEHSRYFDKKITESQRKKISKLLYAPLDFRILKFLRKKLDEKGFPAKLKNIKSEKQFFDIQNTLGEAADSAGVPRVWFDDIWADPDLGKGTNTK